MWTCDADGKEIHLALAYGIRTRFLCFFPTAATKCRPNYAEFFCCRLKIHFRWRRGQVAWGRPHYHVSIWMQMKNRFSINLLLRRPALKVDHREWWINFRFSVHFALITTSCCAARLRIRKKIYNLLSSHRLTGSQREASENETFSGSGPNFDAAIFHPQTFSRKLAFDFVSSPSQRELRVQKVFWQHPRSAFLIALCRWCEALKTFAVAVDANFAFRQKFRTILHKPYSHLN